MSGEFDLQARARASGRCPYCHDDLSAADEAWTCASCGAAHHVACHRELDRCAGCGHEERRQEPARRQPALDPKLLTPDATPEAPSGGALSLALSFEALLLTACAILAALVSAEAAVVFGAGALGLSSLALLFGGVRDGTPFLGTFLAFANLAVLGGGAALVDGLNVRKSPPSAILFTYALVLALLVGALARQRRPRT